MNPEGQAQRNTEMESESPMLEMVRIQHLADNIQKDLDLLKEYEDALRLEYDPRRRMNYRREIERLLESADKYQREYNELRKLIESKSSVAMQNVETKLQDMDTKLNILLTGQNAIHDNLVNLRQTILARFDVYEQTIIRTIIDRLDQEQLVSTQAVLDSIATQRLSEGELQETLNAVREASNEILQHEKIISDPNLANGIEQLSDLVDSPKLDASHKLKITLPIIPFFLSYEGFVELKSGMNLESAWKKLLSRARGKQ